MNSKAIGVLAVLLVISALVFLVVLIETRKDHQLDLDATYAYLDEIHPYSADEVQYPTNAIPAYRLTDIATEYHEEAMTQVVDITATLYAVPSVYVCTLENYTADCTVILPGDEDGN